MRTEAMLEAFRITEDNWRDGCTVDPTFAISESPLFTARSVTALATDADGSAPDSVRYFRDYMRTGQAPRPDDYR